MGRDKLLIGEFLRGYNEHFGTTFQVTELPDHLERQKEAIDAVAKDASGRALAVEHTLIQPFLGEKADAQPLLSVFAPLESDTSLRVAGQAIDVSVPVAAIPKGLDWKAVGARVVVWFRDIRQTLPHGESVHRVPGVGFELTLRIAKDESPYPERRVYVMRSDMPEDFQSVIRKALDDKLSKLAATQADKRILLLEKDNTPRGYTEIGKAIESLRDEFTHLSKVDEIWVANTVAWASESCLFFYRVAPSGVTAKFRLDARYN
jgi:hypothetical protein